MTEEITTEKKQIVIKSLAVAGLFGLAIIIAWLAIQIVQVFPTALTSLASLANSVYNYNPLASKELTVNQPTSVIDVNKPFTLSWQTPKPAEGHFSFSYVCTPGLKLALVTENNEPAELDCDGPRDLGTSTTATLIAQTSDTRFQDVPYNISFFKTDATEPTFRKEAILTFFNDTYAPLAVSTTTPLVEPAPSPASPVTPEVTGTTTAPSITPAPTAIATTSQPIKPQTSATTTENRPKPQPSATTTESRPKPALTTPQYSYTYSYTYGIPASNPNGFTDLSVTLVGVGTLDPAGILRTTGTLTPGITNTIRFTVHNLGTRTSDVWSYTIMLPGGGKYNAGAQTALKPNERATISVSFPVNTKNNFLPYQITTDTTRDSNRTNNQIDSIILVKHK